jgi:hypothetical protein
VLLPVGTIVCCAAVIATSPFRGAGRFLAPTSMVALILLSIFGIRPLIANPFDYDFYGLDAYGGFAYAEVAGLVASVALLLGCHVRLISSRHRNTGQSSGSAGVHAKRSSPIDRPGVRRPLVLLVISIVGLITWLASMVVFGGVGVLPLVLAGRSADLNAALGFYPASLQSLPMLGSAGAAVYILRNAAERRFSTAEVVAIALSVFVSIACTSLEGSRRFLLPSVLVPVGALVIARRGRVGTAVAVALLGGLVATMTLPFVRSAGARVPGQNIASAAVTYLSQQGISGVVYQYFTSYDTEMLNYVAYVGPRLGAAIPYGLGRGTLGDFLLTPLPNRFVPQLYSDQLLEELYGSGCITAQPCPVESEVGVLLFDFGFIGVVLGMFFTGYGLRSLERRLIGSPPYRLRLVGAVVFGYAAIATRTNSMEAIWWAIYFLVLAVLADRIIVFGRARDASRRSEAKVKAGTSTVKSRGGM